MSATTHFIHPQNFPQQSSDFLAWLSTIPGVSINPKIILADLRLQGAGRGVVAQADIQENEELFTIPRDLVLSTRNSKLKALLPQDLEDLGPWLSLMLVMVYEYLQGDSSSWAPYFKVLPQGFDTLMFWSPSELQELQGSAVIEKIGRQSADESILNIIAPVIRANPSLFPPIDGLASYDGDAGTQALLHLAHTMGSLIMAYAFDIEKPEDEDDEGEGEDGYLTDEEEEQLPKGMVPLADLLNADADRNNARLFQEENALVMKSIKPIAMGEEIFNDYGEIPRADLLRRYGYVTDNYAPYDVIEIPLETICQAAGLPNADVESQPALNFLEDLQIIDDGYVIPRPSQDESLEDILPVELVILLKTLALTPDQLAHQTSKNKPPKPSFSDAEASILSKAVQLRQMQYITTISQDQEILAQLNTPDTLRDFERRCKMAVKVRLGEKEIFHRIASMLNTYNNSSSSSKRNANGDGDESRKSKFQRT
ncbi:hypothetical protein FE257_001869 [Aspergillus nanangensis]|uniref:SET domain-containing protein n=1 Tax=Aspergillus nanangensis TaxID=2582783 RepID=A0AAD4CDA1_ASPNN|nr:hypothetical protein FE257_001869 [Aspergillus nanangensis]